MKHFQPSFRVAFPVVMAWSLPIGATFILMDGGLTRCTVKGGLLAFGLSAPAAAILVAIACRFLRIPVNVDGLKLQDSYGIHHEVKWATIREVRPLNFFGLKHARIYTTETGRTLWLPLFLDNMPHFIELVTEHIDPANPLAIFLAERVD